MKEVGEARKCKKSKAAKRRARNKRRRKEKQQRQYQQREEEGPTPAASTSSMPEADKTFHSQHKVHEPRTDQSYQSQHKIPEPPLDAASLMWERTYENSVRWLCSQQVQFLRQQIEHLQQENDFLRAQLFNSNDVDPEEEYITSPSGSEDEYACEYDEAAEVDEGYLQFMEITLRHREELRKTREQEAKQKQQDEGSAT